MSNVLVLAEHQHKKFPKSTLVAIGAGKILAQKSGGTCYAGGPVSAYPEIVLGELDCDAVVLGEGEETVVSLARNGITNETSGIAVRKGSLVIKRPAPPPASIEHPLPFIPRDISTQSIRGANVYIETHRGCSGACRPPSRRRAGLCGGRRLRGRGSRH